MVLFFTFFLSTNLTRAQEYTINPGLSSITFQVTHMGFLNVEGQFASFSGILRKTSDGIEASAEINVTSINTDNTSRDNTIKSEAYLDVESYPTISFTTAKFISDKSQKVLVGELTIKDQTRSVEIKIKEQQLNDALIISGETQISRTNFSLDFGPMDGLISDEIIINLKIAASR